MILYLRRKEKKHSTQQQKVCNFQNAKLFESHIRFNAASITQAQAFTNNLTKCRKSFRSLKKELNRCCSHEWFELVEGTRRKLSYGIQTTLHFLRNLLNLCCVICVSGACAFLPTYVGMFRTKCQLCQFLSCFENFLQILTIENETKQI